MNKKNQKNIVKSDSKDIYPDIYLSAKKENEDPMNTFWAERNTEAGMCSSGDIFNIPNN